ncbi:hypothetical protein AK812_SmicGene41266 [Symbiodinium microadriaticum]|uniref:Uncharacterized protein n=1 Tax=Symbiodinium microadriaticum TaxID=2951 RepID=A0A1Q9C6K4_SYMMI|nr:hypothetical protein AK812_SmicGene41266 [Symbiodinium microadriaticum]
MPWAAFDGAGASLQQPAVPEGYRRPWHIAAAQMRLFVAKKGEGFLEMGFGPIPSRALRGTITVLSGSGDLKLQTLARALRALALEMRVGDDKEYGQAIRLKAEAAARQLLTGAESVLRKLSMSSSRVGKALDTSAALSASLLAETHAELRSDTAEGFQGFPCTCTAEACEGAGHSDELDRQGAAARQLLTGTESVLRKLAMSSSRVGKALDASAALSASLLAETHARLRSDTAEGFQGFAWTTGLVGELSVAEDGALTQDAWADQQGRCPPETGIGDHGGMHSALLPPWRKHPG